MFFYRDNDTIIYNGNARNMSDIGDEVVQCVATSPPYWGLRKYTGNQECIWGGKEDCQHEWNEVHPPGWRKSDTNPSEFQSKGTFNRDGLTSNTCQLCGAWKGAFGLEPTPELYVSHSIEILREVRRVLKKDGTVFWNIGDSYSGSWGNYGSRTGGQREQKVDGFERPAYDNQKERPASSFSQGNIKPKDLCLIPFRIAIAAQDDGWYVRSVIIWNKPNPMPESVKDRPTECHEYILLLTKSAKYFYDMDSVREPQKTISLERMMRNHFAGYDPNYPNQNPQNLNKDEKPLTEEEVEQLKGRNLRSVWTINTKPFPKELKHNSSHFATFPEELVSKMIKAGSREGDIVLDPFMGSGTTLWVAKNLFRSSIGYDISEEYCKMALERNQQQVFL